MRDLSSTPVTNFTPIAPSLMQRLISIAATDNARSARTTSDASPTQKSLIGE